MKIDQIEVIDAATDDTFEVSQEDADNGIPRDKHKCSIALAWRRFDSAAEDVMVGKSRSYKLKSHFGELRWIRYGVSTAIKIQEAILDNDGKLSPGIYTLRALRPSQRTGKQQGSDKNPDRPKPEPTLTKKPNVRRKVNMRENMSTANT